MDKTKLPSLHELGEYAGKLCGDIKESLTEIYHDYKGKHPDDAPEVEAKSVKSKEEKPKEKNTTSKP